MNGFGVNSAHDTPLFEAAGDLLHYNFPFSDLSLTRYILRFGRKNNNSVYFVQLLHLLSAFQVYLMNDIWSFLPSLFLYFHRNSRFGFVCTSQFSYQQHFHFWINFEYTYNLEKSALWCICLYQEVKKSWRIDEEIETERAGRITTCLHVDMKSQSLSK